MKDSVFIFSPSYQTYQFHQDHPFNQLRVYVTYDLLNTVGAFEPGETIAPRIATEAELALVHTGDYIKAVQLAGAGKLPAAESENYGLGTEDTPVFAGMHEAVSIHETGRYLFPGTGQVQERGHGEGYGYAFNIPLDAFTEDESFLESYRTAVSEIAEFFKPDVILSQNGADAHYYDPLTHLCTTMKIYEEIPKLAHELAHTYCNGRWIAVGGGGYDIWRVVPRAWARIWLEMKGMKPEDKMPEKWLKKWGKQASVRLPANWSDPVDLYPSIPRKSEITEKNAQTVAKALYPIRSAKRAT
ncbi:hypothetical protein ACSHMG_04565 [Bacillus [licheniformis] CMCC 63516]|uniref:hypothetical protein n=1 Tax=Bacillus paralicheniformis TaxID=1648923 RepID=UPI0013753694|nr:hypothetical protein [Bacillus paralicheniformis]WOH90312.1 hypothetical protein RZN08_16745 [Bacillus paralicheniformis]